MEFWLAEAYGFRGDYHHPTDGKGWVSQTLRPTDVRHRRALYMFSTSLGTGLLTGVENAAISTTAAFVSIGALLTSAGMARSNRKHPSPIEVRGMTLRAVGRERQKDLALRANLTKDLAKEIGKRVGSKVAFDREAGAEALLPTAQSMAAGRPARTIERSSIAPDPKVRRGNDIGGIDF